MNKNNLICVILTAVNPDMSIIYKYITREILKYIVIVLIAVVAVYIAVDFFERVDNFLEAGLPVSRTLSYLAYKTPFIIAQILPVCILLSVLITFGLMSKCNEIIALKTGGISIYALLKPVMVIGILSTVFLFLFAEIVVPFYAGKANRIWIGEVKKEALVISKEKNIWLKDNRQILHIKHYDKAAQMILGITIYSFDDKFKMIRRIDAEKGIYSPAGWVLYGLMEQVSDKQDDTYVVKYYDELSIPLNLSPENLETVVRKSEEMGIRELREYIHQVESEGYDATRYRVDFHARVAFPFICIILGIVGSGIAGKTRLQNSLPVSIAYGIGIAFLYWIFYSFCVSLGYGGMLPPFIAAWTGNLVFLCFGFYNLMNAE